MNYQLDLHEEVTMIPTDFIRIERSPENFGSIAEFEDFTLELYEFIVNRFPDAQIVKTEIYQESIGCDIQYVNGSSSELFEILEAICENFGFQNLLIETDLFESHREEITEVVAEDSMDWGYDESQYCVNIRQIIQHLDFTAGMDFVAFSKNTATFDTTIVQTGLKKKSEFALKFIPNYLYSEIRTRYVED